MTQDTSSCEHGAPLSELCDSCRQYLQSDRGKAELIAFGLANGWNASAHETTADDLQLRINLALRVAKQNFGDGYDEIVGILRGESSEKASGESHG